MPRFRSRLLRFVVLPLVLAAAAFAAGVAMPLAHLALPAADVRPIVIDDVSVPDLESGETRAGQTIVITGTRIAYVGPAAGAPIPATARRVSGKGKFAIPGLWDMHVHSVDLSPQIHFPLLLANGVTSARDMGDGCSFTGKLDCAPQTRRWLEQRASGQLLAPRLVATASYHVEEASAGVVAALKARGDGMLKLQLDSDAEASLFHSLSAEGGQAGMRVAGHLPYTVDLLDARLAQLDSIEHDHSLLPQCGPRSGAFDGRNAAKLALLRNLDPARCAAVLALMARRGIAYTPTHVASSGQDVQLLSGAYKDEPSLRYIPWPQRALWRLYATAHSGGSDEQDQTAMRAWQAASYNLTAQAVAAGVPVMAGSDSLDPYVSHGFGLHDELAKLVAAGLTPLQALRAATVVPARHMGLERELGTIAIGKAGDIVLLDRDPLTDIAHARAIHAVVANGQPHQRADLDRMLNFVASQAASFSLNCKFLWAMIKPA